MYGCEAPWQPQADEALLALDDTLLALRVKQSTMVNLSDPRSGISEQRLDPGTWLVALNARHSLRFQYEVECKYLLIVDFCSLLAFIDAATPADAHCASGAVGGRQLLMPVPEGSFDSRKATESWFLWQKLEGTREDLRRWLRTKEAYSLISYLLHNSDSAHLNEMCHAYGLSYSHFRKICRNTLGKAAKVKLKEWRVARAVLDIVEGRGSILEVAMQNGYASASHISNEIKRELGITPSMFAHSEKLLKLSDRVSMGVDELKRAAEAAGLRYELLIYPWTGECYGSYPLLPVNHPRFEEAYALLSCKWADWITRVDCRFALLDHYLYLVFNVSMADDDLSAWITEELKIFEELFS